MLTAVPKAASSAAIFASTDGGSLLALRYHRHGESAYSVIVSKVSGETNKLCTVEI